MPLTVSTPALAYTLVGDVNAEALVFVGGLGGVQASWTLQVRSFAERYRVLTYDHRGTGDSEGDDRPMTMRDYAADLVGLLDHCGLARASFVGLSFGGRVLQALALDWPARVRRLVLGGTTCGRSLNVLGDRAFYQAIAQAPLADPAAEAARWQEVIGPALFGARYVARYPERIRGLARWRARHPLNPAGVAQQWAALVEFDACARLGEIQAPTLVLHGDDDRVSPIQNGRILASRIPGARLAVLSGVGHSPNVEAPDEFNALIAAFLEEAAAS